MEERPCFVDVVPDADLPSHCRLISVAEMRRRQASIDRARASVRLEGVILSPEVEEINRQFVEGKIDRDGHVEAILRVTASSSGR